GVGGVGLNVANIGKMDAVFVTKGKIGEEIFKGVDAAFGEQLRALRTDAFDHADFGGEGEGHRSSLYHSRRCGLSMRVCRTEKSARGATCAISDVLLAARIAITSAEACSVACVDCRLSIK